MSFIVVEVARWFRWYFCIWRKSCGSQWLNRKWDCICGVGIVYQTISCCFANNKFRFFFFTHTSPFFNSRINLFFFITFLEKIYNILLISNRFFRFSKWKGKVLLGWTVDWPIIATWVLLLKPVLSRRISQVLWSCINQCKLHCNWDDWLAWCYRVFELLSLPCC